MSWLSRVLGRQTQAPAEIPDRDAPRIASRPIMDRVLKETFVPQLRARGFTGSFPHFRRIAPGRIDLISFQYPRRGGQFVVELSQCPPQVDRPGSVGETPPAKMTVHDTPSGDRFRLSHGWGWRGKIFRYDRPSYDPPLAATEAAMEDSCVKAMRLALKAFDEQAEQWWGRNAAGSKDA